MQASYNCKRSEWCWCHRARNMEAQSDLHGRCAPVPNASSPATCGASESRLVDDLEASTPSSNSSQHTVDVTSGTPNAEAGDEETITLSISHETALVWTFFHRVGCGRHRCCSFAIARACRFARSSSKQCCRQFRFFGRRSFSTRPVACTARFVAGRQAGRPRECVAQTHRSRSNARVLSNTLETDCRAGHSGEQALFAAIASIG